MKRRSNNGSTPKRPTRSIISQYRRGESSSSTTNANSHNNTNNLAKGEPSSLEQGGGGANLSPSSSYTNFTGAGANNTTTNNPNTNGLSLHDSYTTTNSSYYDPNVPVNELNFYSFHGNNSLHSDAVNSGLGFDDDDDDDEDYSDTASFASHSKFDKSMNHHTNNHIVQMNTLSNSISTSQQQYHQHHHQQQQHPQQYHETTKAIIMHQPLSNGSNHSFASRAFNFFGNRRRKHHHQTEVLPLSTHTHSATSPHHTTPKHIATNSISPYHQPSPTSILIDYDDNKYSKEHRKHQRRAIIQKLFGMMLVICYAVLYTRSVHKDLIQVKQEELQAKQNQHATIPANYRRLRDDFPYYIPNLYQPTDLMKQQFLSFEHLKSKYHTTTAEDEYPLLHVIRTRFMQEQANLLALGEARLALFNIFCLPTMLQQTTQNFIWIIKIDPNLHPTLLQQLIDSIIMDPIPHNATSTTTGRNNDHYFRGNIYVMTSNINYRVLNSDKKTVATKGSWKDGVEPKELASGDARVYTGNRTILEWYMSLETQLPVLETRLDSDDGLHSGYIHMIQQKGYETFYTVVPNEGVIPSNVQWMYWCARRHIEWHWTDNTYYPVPNFNNKKDNEEDTLSTMIAKYGAIQGIQHNRLCITPGITTGYNIETLERTVPVYSHDELYKSIHADTNDISCGRNTPKECLQFIENFVFEAIRSRGPTSAGMAQISPNYVELRAQHTWWVTYVFWNMLHDSFGPGITRTSLAWMNQYLSKNLIDIVTDNLHGQCTTGHSCKKQAKKELQTLFDQAKQRQELIASAAVQHEQQQQQQQQHDESNNNNNNNNNLQLLQNNTSSGSQQQQKIIIVAKQ